LGGLRDRASNQLRPHRRPGWGGSWRLVFPGNSS